MISIVVLTRNRFHTLKNCIHNIERRSKLPHEIIVVDNGSTDGTVEWLKREKSIRPVFSDNKLGVIARNLGFEIAKGELIAQVDDDVIVHDNWDVIMNSYIKGDVKATGQQGAYVCRDWSNFNEGSIPVGGYCDVLTGFCWMFKNEGWRYDTAFVPFWHEESELQIRMGTEKGYRKMRCPEVCSHASKRTEQVNWDIHNKHIDLIREKYKGKYVSERDRVGGKK